MARGRISGEFVSATNMLFAVMVGAAAAAGSVYAASKLVDNEPVRVHQTSENKITIVPPRPLYGHDQRIVRIVDEINNKCSPVGDLVIDRNKKFNVLFVETAVKNCRNKLSPSTVNP